MEIFLVFQFLEAIPLSNNTELPPHSTASKEVPQHTKGQWHLWHRTICRIKCFCSKPLTVGDLEADPGSSVPEDKEFNAIVLAHLYSHLQQAGVKHTNPRPIFQQLINSLTPAHQEHPLSPPQLCCAQASTYTSPV